MKYKLKEELRKYYIQGWQDGMPLGKWREQNVSFEALEEVEERIELITSIASNFDYNVDILCKVDGSKWSKEEVKICEKALNGELISRDSFLKIYDVWLNCEDDGVDVPFDEYLKSIK